MPPLVPGRGSWEQAGGALEQGQGARLGAAPVGAPGGAVGAGRGAVGEEPVVAGRRTSRRSSTSAASPSASRAWSMSNHSDFEYISQWYGRERREVAARPRPASPPRPDVRAAIAPCDPVPACAHSDSSDSRIVPNRSVPDVDDRRAVHAGGQQARRGQVVGVDELVAVRAVAEHERRRRHRRSSRTGCRRCPAGRGRGSCVAGRC